MGSAGLSVYRSQSLACHLASVAHDETAVDVDGLARHVIGVTAGEKAHDASHVFRSFGSPEWDQRGSPLPGFTDFPTLYLGPLSVDLPPHRRVDRARTNAIRSDPVGRQHLRRSARDADNAGFASGVVDHVRQTTPVGSDRRGLDQLSAQLCTRNRALTAHAFSGALQHEKDSTQVYRQGAVPLVLSELEQLPGFGDPSVVEQHIQATPALVGQIEHTLNVVCTGNVRLDGRLPKLVSKGFCAVTIYVGQQQLRAIPYHASSAGGADATRSARDERMNTPQPVSHLTSASYRRQIRRKRVRNRAGIIGECC